jgi:hypothetical protein
MDGPPSSFGRLETGGDPHQRFTLLDVKILFLFTLFTFSSFRIRIFLGKYPNVPFAVERGRLAKLCEMLRDISRGCGGVSLFFVCLTMRTSWVGVWGHDSEVQNQGRVWLKFTKARRMNVAVLELPSTSLGLTCKFLATSLSTQRLTIHWPVFVEQGQDFAVYSHVAFLRGFTNSFP